MNWADAVAGYRTYMTSRGMSPGTIRLRTYQLRRLATEVGAAPFDVTQDHVETWLASHPTWSAETRKSCLTTTRMFYAWAGRRGGPRNPCGDLNVRVPAAKARPTPDRVVAVALKRADRRERLLILLAVRGGLRRAEVAAVRGDDLDDTDQLRVVGKGRRLRMVPIVDDELLTALRSCPGWLFPGRTGGHLSPGHVGEILSSLLGPGWTAHTLRHRCATRAYAGTHDLLAVQRLLGHSSPTTTQIYVSVPDEGLFAAVRAAA